MTAEYATRAELERLEDRVDRIDTGGTRGVAVLAIQIQTLSQDLAKHEKQHELEASRRASNRKWWVMAVIAAIAAIDGPVVAIWLQFAHH